ncbi:MAG: DUF309 domain-containing protein [Desulfovibrio sp.]
MISFSPIEYEAPPELFEAVELFNEQEFYEAHEVLEDLWHDEPRPIRAVYQGVLQIGVGIYHMERGNFKGAVRLIGGGCELIEPHGEEALDLCLGKLRRDGLALLAELTRLGPDRLEELDRTLIMTIDLC